ncbi:MAG: nucleotidyltransferase family protein [Clostridia bacterium]|nr:nucleotidyltransferase family protein [Clostridia bacterium]
MRETTEMLFQCIKSALNGAEITGFSPDMLGELCALATAHDMAHLVAEALDAAGLLNGTDEATQTLRRARFAAVFRAEQMDEALAAIREAFSAENIPFLPLKGAVIRELYPARWQRTSCDIDVLVSEENLSAAADALTDGEEFTLGEKGAHDLSLYSTAGVHVELHYTLVEDHIPPVIQRLLRAVWRHTFAKAAEHTLDADYFYFYHIAHMAKHFALGGCGIRPLLDLWLLRKHHSYTAELDMLLDESGLATFEQSARHLASVWFDDAAHNDVTARMEAFILRGGVYGTLENQIAVAQKKRGKLGYLLSKIFVPYRVLKHQYPIIQRHKWLTPVCHVRRWCKLLLGGEWRRVRRALRVNNGMTRAAVRAAGKLFSDLEL